LDEQLVVLVVFQHYQQYQDVYNITVFLNHNHVYQDQMLEQEMQQDIDDHEQ
jgi:hypothetical protein